MKPNVIIMAAAKVIKQDVMPNRTSKKSPKNDASNCLSVNRVILRRAKQNDIIDYVRPVKCRFRFRFWFWNEISVLSLQCDLTCRFQCSIWRTERIQSLWQSCNRTSMTISHRTVRCLRSNCQWQRANIVHENPDHDTASGQWCTTKGSIRLHGQQFGST